MRCGVGSLFLGARPGKEQNTFLRKASTATTKAAPGLAACTVTDKEGQTCVRSIFLLKQQALEALSSNLSLDTVSRSEEGKEEREGMGEERREKGRERGRKENGEEEINLLHTKSK